MAHLHAGTNADPGEVNNPMTENWMADFDNRFDPMVVGLSMSGHARNHFTGSSGIVDDEFANFLDRGARTAQVALYAREAAERAAAAQRRREREKRMNEEHKGSAAQRTVDQQESQQTGTGLLGRLHTSAVDFGRRNLCPKETAPNYPGENHAPCANFCGPGTRVYDRIARGDKPVNSADAACKQHDLDYAKSEEDQRAGKLTREQMKRRVREADDRMLKSVARTKGEGGLMSRFHHAVGKQVISAKKKLEDAGVLDPQKFVDPDDSNDSEAAAPEQEGGSRGIRRRRRALTQQQNRDRALQAAQEFAWRDDVIDNIARQEAALQPISGPLTRRTARPDNDSNEQYEVEQAMDRVLQGQYIPDADVADEAMEEQLTHEIQDIEEGDDGQENDFHINRYRRMLLMQRLFNETLRENEEQRRADAYVRQMQGYDQLQGSGVIAGMGFATYLG